MKRVLLPTAVGLALILAMAVHADDKSDITALYKKLETVLKTQKYDSTLALETKDFAATGDDGKPMNGKQMVVQMKKENQGVTSIKSLIIKIKSISVSGKTAKATTSFSLTSNFTDAEGDMGPKGLKHVMVMKGSVSNDLEKTAAGWKFKSMKMVGSSMTMDGKPMGNAAGGAR